MCNHHKNHTAQNRHGSSLEHGSKAHQNDHINWNRRSFLKKSGLLAAGAPILLGGTAVQALGHNSLFQKLATAEESDRIMVVVVLAGGNDGLNTIVPVENDIYYNARGGTTTQGGLGIAKSDTFALDSQHGLHPAMASLKSFWAEDKMSVVHNVGYPNPDLSHFRSTDIWVSASEANVVENTGWMGRYLDKRYPNFADDKPENPLAVQVGGYFSLLFQGQSAGMGMSMLTPDYFNRIAGGGEIYPTDNLSAAPFGQEMAFARTIANDSYLYADAIQAATETGANDVEYPEDNYLAENLAIVAQLIKGDLGSKIYVVQLGGFDTHSDQIERHNELLTNLSTAVSAFYEDLTAGGKAKDTLTVTISEFGRRVEKNESHGTDHGTAAPLFVFGEGTTGGFFGTAPDLANLDEGGNINHTMDYRSVYASLMRDWFGLSSANVEDVLDGEFDALPIIEEPILINSEGQVTPQHFVLSTNFPNPFTGVTTIPYQLDRRTTVNLSIYDIAGRRVTTLINEAQEHGKYEVTFRAGDLANGTYFYRLQTKHGVISKKMVLLR